MGRDRQTWVATNPQLPCCSPSCSGCGEANCSFRSTLSCGLAYPARPYAKAGLGVPSGPSWWCGEGRVGVEVD